MKRMNSSSFLWIAGLMALMVPRIMIAAAISGNINFWGDSDGIHPIEIAAHVALGQPPVSAVQVSSPGGSYNLPVDDGSYYIAAFLDRDESSGKPDLYEPLVWYDADGDGLPDMVTVSGGNVTGINVDLGFVYVDIDATGTHDGSSWTNAFIYFNEAITAAVSGIEVWVAQGTYVPPGIDRRNRFILKNGVRVYGGFAGNEKTRGDRDPSAFQTTLSGEIGAAGTADNVYNVVWVSGTNTTPLLDGFTITGGRADGGAPWNQGGGLYAYFGGATIVNVTFTGNYASQAGGGIATNGGVVHVYNSGFFGNQAGVYPAGTGGGFYGKTYGEKLVNCVFSGNSAGLRGGAIYMESGSFGGTLTGLSVNGNTSGWEAGGLFIDNNGTTDTLISNSIVWGNNAQQILTWGPVQVSYSLVQGGLTGGTNISTADPLFRDTNGVDDVPGTPDDNLRLQDTSLAIDAGNNAAVPLDAADLDEDLDSTEVLPVDFDFNARFANMAAIPDTGNGSVPIVDLGAYEIFPSPLIFKDGFESVE
jgi:predicted outer membrane repeat protein